jgi:hypothetical protein
VAPRLAKPATTITPVRKRQRSSDKGKRKYEAAANIGTSTRCSRAVERRVSNCHRPPRSIGCDSSKLLSASGRNSLPLIMHITVAYAASKRDVVQYIGQALRRGERGTTTWQRVAKQSQGNNVLHCQIQASPAQQSNPLHEVVRMSGQHTIVIRGVGFRPIAPFISLIRYDP